MNTIGTKTPVDIISFINNHSNILWNLTPEELVNSSLQMGMGQLSNNDVLAIDTGKFTGRSPKDRFIVRDSTTIENIDWGDINQAIDEVFYQKLKRDLMHHLSKKQLAKIISHIDYSECDIGIGREEIRFISKE